MAGIEKWAALSDEEKALYRKIVQNQARFDAQSSGGQMSEAQKELHRQNTERLKMFAAKKRDDSAKIPGWAKDPEGTMPGGSAKSRYGGAAKAGPDPQDVAQGYYRSSKTYGPREEKFLRWASKNPRAFGALAGGAFGTAYGGLDGGLQSLVDLTSHGKVWKKHNLREAKEDDSPIGEYIVEHPAKAGILLGAPTGALAGAGAMHSMMKNKGILPGILGASALTATGILGADKYLAHRRKQDAPSKPTKAPVNTPNMPKSA